MCSDGRLTGRDHPFRLHDGAARREAGAGQRRVPLGRPPLRPDERPDVGRAAPGLEGCARHGARARRASVPSATSTSPAAPATSPSASSMRAEPLTHVTVLDINGDMLEVGRERARRAATTAASISSRRMPRPCRSRTRRSTATRSPSASATCRASTRRSREAHRVLQPRRPLPVPRILERRPAGPRRALRRLFVQRHPAPRRPRHGRRRVLPLPRRVDPPLPAARRLRAHDRGGRLRAGDAPRH